MPGCLMCVPILLCQPQDLETGCIDKSCLTRLLYLEPPNCCVFLPRADRSLFQYNGFLTVHGHAMHCVGVLRHHLTRATESREEQDPVEMEHANGHCIEVIRRALECTPNLYMTGVIDSNFWDARTSNNPLMCRAGVTEWLSKRVRMFLHLICLLPWSSISLSENTC